MDDWAGAFEPRTVSSEPLPPERRPPRIAFDEHEIESTAIPLFAQTEDFVGIVVIFWPHE